MRRPDHPPDISAFLKTPGAAGRFVDAVNDVEYQEAARRATSLYRHWAKVRYMANASGLSWETLWLMVKSARSPTHRTIPLFGEKGTQLKFSIPDAVQEELMHVDQQLAGRLVSSDEKPLDPSQREKFILSALREEAIASSMLEGAATTRRDAKEMLTSGRKPRTTGERMVVNNYLAISFIREKLKSPMTPELLLQVQAILTEGTLEDEGESGRFRTDKDDVAVTNNFGEVLHDPPPASELPNRLKALCDFANATDGPFIHPVIRASLIHFQIGFDHPFCDGNGRTARALFYWAMLRAGYWLFEYIAISRLIYASPAKYGRAYLYTETDEFDVTYFLMYKANIIKMAREELADYIARKQKEMLAARKVFESDDRLNHRQREVIVRLIRATQTSAAIHEHMMRNSIAYGTARSDLLDLAKWHYLAKMRMGNRFEFVPGPLLVESIPPPAKRRRNRRSRR